MHNHLFPTGEFLGKHVGPMHRVIHEVARFALMSPSDIVGPSRERKFAYARQLAMMICHEYTNASFPEIGRAFNRDHSTVMYGIKAARHRCKPADWNDIRNIAKRAGVAEPETFDGRAKRARQAAQPQTQEAAQ
jgi:hypothetical protein